MVSSEVHVDELEVVVVARLMNTYQHVVGDDDVLYYSCTQEDMRQL